MKDIFSILAIRNAEGPSPKVLQPRLPSLFEPSNSVDGSPESIFDQTFSLQPQAARKDNSEQPSAMSFDGESPSSSHVSIQEPPTFNIKDSSIVRQPSNQLDVESGREMTILQPGQPQESINSYSTMASSDELQNDLRRSETVVSHAERAMVRNHKNDSHWMKENVEERVVRPRMESLAANKVEGNNHSPRSVPGGGEKSMNIVLPHEESQQEEAPVVRIHIGRIDVRAITQAPAQPASKPAPAQPRLTLDDYLRQREGRR